MRLSDGRRDPWFWRFDLHVGVNFCVWALLADGLRVSPFDRHAGGDGALRAAGLTPEGWWTWLHAVLARQEQLRAALAATDRALPREWAMGAHLTYDGRESQRSTRDCTRSGRATSRMPTPGASVILGVTALAGRA